MIEEATELPTKPRLLKQSLTFTDKHENSCEAIFPQ